MWYLGGTIYQKTPGLDVSVYNVNFTIYIQLILNTTLLLFNKVAQTGGSNINIAANVGVRSRDYPAKINITLPTTGLLRHAINWHLIFNMV